MTENRVEFSFHGVRVTVTGEPDILNRLRYDFAYFLPQQSCFYSVDLSLKNRFTRPLIMFPFFNSCCVSGFYNKRSCLYKDGSFIEFLQEKQSRKATLFGTTSDRAYEIAYFFILSSIGEILEKKGWIRLHALSYVKNNSAQIMVMNSGQGKSSSAAAFVASGEALLFSDEITMIYKNKIYPFPLPISLRPEVIQNLNLSLNFDSEKKWSNGVYKKTLRIPENSIAEPTEVGTITSDSLLQVISGIGLPQMSEYLLRFDNFFTLLKVAFRRAKIFAKIIMS